MKKFEEPMVDVIAFATENVLEASGTGDSTTTDPVVPVLMPPCI